MTIDLFAVFELPQSFDLDISTLEKQYFAAQRKFHPDRLVGKSSAERQQAINQSMLVNEAHDTLKNPLKRAQHILALNGIKPDLVKPSQELLMEIMELREALSEAESVDATVSLAERNMAAINETLANLSKNFKIAAYDEAAKLAMRLSYLTKLEDEIRIRRKSFASA